MAGFERQHGQTHRMDRYDLAEIKNCGGTGSKPTVSVSPVQQNISSEDLASFDNVLKFFTKG